ncbi:hypothetical protein ACJ41P_10510 [Azospirillum argentinense]|uniref:Uncharacterized protein n=1 Tax=Azospirillum argentinense TaxID=2970906 RepID=A0ABW8V8G9_9PROT
MPLIVSIPDDIAAEIAAHRAVIADKPKRARKVKGRDEWRGFVAKKFGEAAVVGAISDAARSRKVLSASERASRDRIKAAAAISEVDPLDEITKDPDSGIKVARYGTDKGTAPTRKRLQADPCETMLSKGQLTQEQYDATTMILAAYQIITQGMGARIATYGASAGGGRDDYESVWAITVQERYLDWVDAMAERAAANAKAKRGGNKWKTWLPLDVIVEGITCQDIAHQRGMKTQTVADYLRDALDLYNDVRFGRIKRGQRMAA